MNIFQVISLVIGNHSSSKSIFGTVVRAATVQALAKRCATRRYARKSLSIPST